jgi:outer membrane protein assembly factor BamB
MGKSLYKTIFLLILVFTSGCQNTYSPSWATPMAPHQIAGNSKTLTKVWEKTLYTLSVSSTNSQCVSFGNMLYVIGSLNENEAAQLIALDGNDGALLWSFPITGKLANSDDELFIGHEDTLLALDPSNGSQIWKTTLPYTKDIVKLFYFNDILFVSSTGYYQFFTIEPSNGTVIEKFISGDDFYSSFLDLPFYPDYPYEKILYGNLSIEQWGDIAYSVYAVDRETRQTVWHVSDDLIISNIAVLGTTVFMVSTNSSLELIDITNGELIESLPVLPIIDFYNIENNVQYAGYYLCADQTMQSLYLILGDSRQLIAYHYAE